jgi:tagaturonate reductase
MNTTASIKPLLSKEFVLANEATFKITKDSFILPEKVIQFGTGVLLRGLADYLIDKANRHNYFNGRVVVVKSTGSDVSEFTRQNNCYTLLEKGIRHGRSVEEKHLITCISRVLAALDEWEAILECAANPAIEFVISNTTEAGLVFIPEKIVGRVPESFPAKLTAYLWQRYLAFDGTAESGMVILPTELVSDNGRTLKKYIVKHAVNNGLPKRFIRWIKKCNHFCNTLVDRIVPGKSEKDDHIVWLDGVIYQDVLHITAEPFLLWAIEGGGYLKERLSFFNVDERVILTEDISGFKEQKLRILNGSNSLVVSPAYLAGCETLYDTVNNQLFKLYTTTIINDEIIPALPRNCTNASEFAEDVLERFANPHVQYRLSNIVLQFSSKMNSRNTDSLIRYYHLHQRYPPLTLIGWACFFLFYTPAGKEGEQYYGEYGGRRYFYRDEHTEFLCENLTGNRWDNHEEAEDAISRILNNPEIFSRELSTLPVLSSRIAQFCLQIKKEGVKQTISLYLVCRP